MDTNPLTRAELTARATEAAKRYRDLADQGVRPRSSGLIADHLERIANGDVLYAADFVHKRRSYLAEFVRGGIAVGVIDRSQVVILGSGTVNEDVPQSKLYAAVQAAQALGSHGISIFGERLTRSDTSRRYWLVIGPVISDVEV